MTPAIAGRERLIAGGATLLVLALALGRLWWLPSHASLNINEGWNAGHVARAFGAGALYPAPDALIANNYPPLSFLIVGLIDKLIGDAVLTGRVVALLSQLAVGWAAYTLAARLTGERRWAVAAALLFAGYGVTLLRGYLAMDDPQWLAEAVAVWALILLVPVRPDARLTPSRVLGAAVLTVAAVLTKHNLVAVPVAATLWLWVSDRRSCALWVGTGATLSLAAGAVLYTVWGTTVFADVLAPARSYSVARMAAHGAPLLLAVLPGVLAARPLTEAWRRDPRLLLPVLLLAVAVPTAVVQRSGDGVDVNALFETVFALAVAVPAGCALRWAAGVRWLGAAALPALALVPVAALADARELAGRGAAERHWAPFIARVATAPGAVACDDQAVCHWAGRSSALDFFALKQRLLKGEVPALTAALEAHAFRLIAMRSENRGWHENRLIPLVRAHYRTLYAEGGYELLVPGERATSSSSRSRIAPGSANASRR